MNPAPHLKPEDRVVLFDGVCVLCTWWTRFLTRYDVNHKFLLCSIQSPEGLDILAWAGIPVDDVNTMLHVSNNTAYTRSDAFIEVMGQLGLPWSLARILKIVPRFFRNACYNFIAHNRYRFFGKSDVCMMPTPENQSRFLKSQTAKS